MNIIVFGASGGTGREIVRQARARAHQVTAYVRRADSLPSAAGVRIVEGDALAPAAVSAAIAGHDAVLSALGARHLGPSDLLERASSHIIAGMKAHGVRRLVVLGAAGALHDAGRHQGPLRRLFFEVVRRSLLRYGMQSSAEQERRVEASGLEYTVVHPPRLTNGPHTRHYRVDLEGLPAGSVEIARADVADFMLRVLEENTFVRVGPYIGY